MAGDNEAVIVRMGLDTGPLATALRGTEKTFEKTGERIKEQFKDLGGEIAASLSLAGAIGLIENTFQKVQQITRASESVGVSTDFIQTIEAAGKAAGISSEQIEKALDKFAQGLPAGSDVEKEFYDTADAIAAIEDPAERARMATEAFGKAGVKMIAILKDGKAGVQDMAAAFGKLSEEEIKAVEDAHLRIEQTQSNLTLLAGGFINMIQKAGTFWATVARGVNPMDVLREMDREKANDDSQKKAALEAEKAARAAKAEQEAREHTLAAIEKYKVHLQDIALQSTDTSYEDKHAILDSRYQKAIQESKDAKNDIDRVAALTKAADLKEKIQELEKKHTDELDKQAKKEQESIDRLQKKKDAAYDAVTKAELNLSEAQRKPYEFTLEDLAKSNGFESGTARDVVQLREWAKWNFMHGNFDLGEEQKNLAEREFAGLTRDNKYLQNPYEKMIDELEKANEKLNGTLTVKGED